MRKQQVQCYNASLSIKSKAVKFFMTFLFDNCDAFVFSPDLEVFFFTFCGSIFSEAQLKAYFSSFRMMAYRKLAGKIEFSSIF